MLEMTPPPGLGGSPPKIGGGDALVFQMELITIKGDKVEQPWAPYISSVIFCARYAERRRTGSAANLKFTGLTQTMGQL